MTDRRSFDTTPDEPKKFNQLVQQPSFSKPRPSVTIKGEDEFEDPTLINGPRVRAADTTNAKRGRKVVFTDQRYKATQMKRVSPVVELKFNTLSTYMTELINAQGKVSFNEILDRLVDKYVSTLPAPKRETYQADVAQGMKKLKK